MWDVVTLEKTRNVGKLVRKSKVEHHFRVMVGQGGATPTVTDVLLTWSVQSRMLRIFVRDIKVLEMLVHHLEMLDAKFCIGPYTMKVFNEREEFRIALAD